ncbi:MAG TPA: hypothetical protein VFE33_36305 [Thermoanaerobaculia bacterium]|nr:hypothetical protein [Thermoanaerobaculia bacterium]
MNPPVAQPCAFRTSARVTRSGASLKPPLSRTPCAPGKSPVISEQWAGRVSGVGEMAFSNRTPWAARRSRLGVSTSREP